MATTQKAVIKITCDGKEADNIIKQLKNDTKALAVEMQKLRSAGQTDSAKYKKLEQSYRALENALKQNKAGYVQLGKVMDNLSKASLRQLEQALRTVKQEMKKVSADEPQKIAQLRNQYSQLTSQINRLNSSLGQTKTMGVAHNGFFGNAVRNITVYLGVMQAVNIAITKFKKVFTDNFALSDQLANIRKVSGLAYSEINELDKALAKIDTRTSIQELNDIAYAGAKLGIGKYGAQGLESFVKASNQVNVALKEDLGADALTALSKITEVMGLIPKMGVEKSMLSVGSAMFQLSSTSTATSANIVEFAKRLTGMARVAGISTDQLLALGSASDSMYLMPEVASTAFNKLLAGLQTNHNLIEKALSIPKGTIGQLFEAGKAMDALVLIFEKMKEKGNMNALAPIFKDLDAGHGARVKNVVVTMAKNVEMLKEHLETSKEAFEEGMAVTQEYMIQQETAQALMERANNTWEKAFVNPDGVDMVKEMAQSWYDMSQTLTGSTFYMSQLHLLITMVANAVRILIYLLPSLLTALMFTGAIKALTAMTTGFYQLFNIIRTGFATAGFGGVISALVNMKTATDAATAAQIGLNAAQKANVILGLASIILGIVTAIWSYVSAANSASNETKSWADQVRDMKAESDAAFNGEVRKINSVVAAWKDANTTQEERRRLINLFRRDYGEYLRALGLEATQVLSTKAAYDKLVGAIKDKLRWQMKEKALDQVDQGVGQELAKRMMAYTKWTKDDGVGKNFRGYTAQWIRDHQSKGSDWVFNHIVSNVFRPSNLQMGRDGKYMFRSSSGDFDSIQALRDHINNIIGGQRYYDKQIKVVEDTFGNVPLPVLEDDSPGSLDNAATDNAAASAAKAAATQAKKEENERQRKLKKQREDELKKNKDDIKGIIANAENYFTRQDTFIKNMANTLNLGETELQQLLDENFKRKNQAMAQLRLAIAGKDNSWNEELEYMGSLYAVEKDKEGKPVGRTAQLLGEMGKTDIAAITKNIANLNGLLGYASGGLLDEVWNKASQNENANETLEMKRRQRVHKEALDDDNTAKVNEEYMKKMSDFGIWSLPEDQKEIILANGENAKPVIAQRNADMQEVFNNARRYLADIYAIENPSSEAGLIQLREILSRGTREGNFAVNAITYPDTTSNSTDVAPIPDAEVAQVFYETIIKYVDDFDEAMKKERDRQKKIIEERWKQSDEKISGDRQDAYWSKVSSQVGQYDAGIQKEVANGGRMYRNDVYGTSSFVSSMGKDPEIEVLKNKMLMQQQYYEMMKQYTSDRVLLAAQEQSILDAEMAYAKAVASQMKQRMEDMYAIAQPVEDFGEAVGKAFATMTEDAEEGRKEMKAAIGDLMNAMIKQTFQMTTEWIKRRMFQKINDRLTSVQMRKAAAEQVQIEEDKQDDTKKENKKGLKATLKAVTKGIGDLFKFKKKKKKEEKKIEEQGLKEQTDVVEEGIDAKSTVQKIGEEQATDALMQVKTQAVNQEKQATQESVQTKSQETQAKTTMGIAEGASEIIGKLGWWGIPLVAVITALLNGLLGMAMSKVSSLFGGGGDKSSDSGPSTKLVSGMLTYDAGNVQAFRGVEDGKTYPVVGNDGRVYAARDGGELSTGLVKDPITTLINGQPALVAERGPEMVIGRETTAAMMMARPDLLRAIVQFDRNRSGMNYRAYDAGNVQQFSPAPSDGNLNAATAQQLSAVVSQLADTLSAIQQHGIPAHIRKFGKGGLIDEVQSGMDFMSRNAR